MCTTICPCNIADNAKWKGLSQDDLTPFNRKVYSEAADADPTALFFQNDGDGGLKTYSDWLTCYNDMKAGTQGK